MGYAASCSAAALDLTLVSLDSQKFPFVYLSVAVERNGVGLTTLTPGRFYVSENNVAQTDYFDVVPPDTGGSVRIVDIVFLMDNSGSMGIEQAAVRANVQAFVDALEAQGVDYRLGLCRFGATANGGKPIVEDGGALTPDAEYFKNEVWGRNTVDGGHEPGWDALFDATTSFAFRGGAQKVFILITDECVTHPGDTNFGDVAYDTALNALQAGSITMFALIDLAYENSIDDYGTIAQATNGEYYDIYSSFDDILAFISSQVVNTYRITYKSSRPFFDGIERDVFVQVTYRGDTASCTGSYTPGSGPRIQRTQETLALHNTSWATGTPLTIRAEITDNHAPLVQNATLYYRRTGDAGYSSTAMAHGSDIWTGIIPGASVQDPGVDYYISATDGQSTATDPSVDPRDRPHQLAVLPNVAPVITHTPVTTAAEGTGVAIVATIADTTNSLDSATLWYRKVGQLVYTSNNGMQNTGGSTYEDTIPGGFVTSGGVEYYIHAEDDVGVGNSHGTRDNPHLIAVTGNQTPNTTLESWETDESAGSATFTWSGDDDETPTGSLEFCYRLLGEGSPTPEWSMWDSSKTKTYTGLPAGEYRFEARAKDADGAVDPSPASEEFEIGEALQSCTVHLRPRGVAASIGVIEAFEAFDIYVGASTGIIAEVRFSSDESLDDVATGEWTGWFAWDISVPYVLWDGVTKTMPWSFSTEGNKEVWAEIRGNGGSSSDSKSINVSISSATHSVAYFPVQYKSGPGTPESKEPDVAPSVLAARARLVELYYAQVSYGQVDIYSRFVFQDQDGLPLYHELDKSWEEYTGADGEFSINERKAVFRDALANWPEGSHLGLPSDYEAIILIQPDLRLEEHSYAVCLADDCFPLGAGRVLSMAEASYVVWAHELGHSIFGWWDYYPQDEPMAETSSRGHTIYWGLMGKGMLQNPPAPVIAYNLERSGWVDYLSANISEEYEIEMLDEIDPDTTTGVVYRYFPDVGDTKYFVFEGRDPPEPLPYKIGEGIDQEVDTEQGVIVYQVIENPSLPREQECVYPLPYDRLGPINDPFKVTLLPGSTCKRPAEEVLFRLREEAGRLYLEIEEHTPLTAR